MFVPQAHMPRTPRSYMLDEQTVARHMSESIRFATVSAGIGNSSSREPFEDFISWLAETYPLVHSRLARERIAQYSLLYRWQGSGSGRKPVLLTAHYDVVPVVQSSREEWIHEPFAGEIENGWVWGRGALDDKSAVIAIMEALTVLLKNGHEPLREIYVAIGHDEELGGAEGAAGIVSELQKRGVEFAWSLDEGSYVLDGIVPGLDIPLASINLSEKGFLTVKIVAKSSGGHSSMPPQDMAIYTLAEVLNDLHRSPFANHLDSGPAAEMYVEIARHMPFTRRMLFANQWLFRPLLERVLTRGPAGAAMLRTTIAPTMLRAGIKENVLAPEAEATVNLRIHPADNVNDVVSRLKQVIERAGVTVTVSSSDPPSSVSSSGSAGFTALSSVARDVFGEVVVAPGLTIAGTDSRHYEKVSDDSYRFNPMKISSEDLATFHGVNERISVENLLLATTFYAALIEETSR